MVAAKDASDGKLVSCIMFKEEGRRRAEVAIVIASEEPMLSIYQRYQFEKMIALSDSCLDGSSNNGGGIRHTATIAHHWRRWS